MCIILYVSSYLSIVVFYNFYSFIVIVIWYHLDVNEKFSMISDFDCFSKHHIIAAFTFIFQ